MDQLSTLIDQSDNPQELRTKSILVGNESPLTSNSSYKKKGRRENLLPNYLYTTSESEDSSGEAIFEEKVTFRRKCSTPEDVSSTSSEEDFVIFKSHKDVGANSSVNEELQDNVIPKLKCDITLPDKEVEFSSSMLKSTVQDLDVNCNSSSMSDESKTSPNLKKINNDEGFIEDLGKNERYIDDSVVNNLQSLETSDDLGLNAITPSKNSVTVTEKLNSSLSTTLCHQNHCESSNIATEINLEIEEADREMRGVFDKNPEKCNDNSSQMDELHSVKVLQKNGVSGEVNELMSPNNSPKLQNLKKFSEETQKESLELSTFPEKVKKSHDESLTSDTKVVESNNESSQSFHIIESNEVTPMIDSSAPEFLEKSELPNLSTACETIVDCVPKTPENVQNTSITSEESLLENSPTDAGLLNSEDFQKSMCEQFSLNEGEIDSNAAIKSLDVYNKVDNMMNNNTVVDSSVANDTNKSLVEVTDVEYPVISIDDIKSEVPDLPDELQCLLQPEVVMSDCSDQEDENGSNEAFVGDIVEQYTSSMVKAQSLPHIITNPPVNNKCGPKVLNLDQWLLQKVGLPQYHPTQEPPPWVRVTIPPEGYKCLSCSDLFFLESSLQSHKERRSMLITFHCSFCELTLYFFNKCVLRDHIREHGLKGEKVFEKDIRVKTLPLHLTQLMEPLGVNPPALMRQGSSRKGKQSQSAMEIPEKITSVGTEMKQLSNFPGNNSSKNVPCYICGEQFGSIRDLMDHLKTNQSRSEKYPCEKCTIVLPSQCSATAHIHTHTLTLDKLVCPECGSKCDTTRSLVQHLNACGHQFRRSGILCPVCRLCFFTNVEAFIIHWIMEHCDFGEECPLCFHVIDQKTPDVNFVSWQSHLRCDHPDLFSHVDYVFKSRFCGNSFKTKDELRYHHEREHSKETNYIMKNCSLTKQVESHKKKFADSYIVLPFTLSEANKKAASLRRWPMVMNVDDEKSFHSVLRDEDPPNLFSQKVEISPKICYLCGTDYSGTFDTHQRDCVGFVRGRTCMACKTYATGPGFVDHCLGHTNDGLFVCIYCNGTSFKSAEELTLHFTLHVEEQFKYPFICVFCSQSLPDKTKALIHIKIKHHIEGVTSKYEHECKSCHKMFTGRGLQLHKCGKNITVLPVVLRACKFCSKTLSQETAGKHLSAHLENGGIMCGICDGLPIFSKALLLNHLQDHLASFIYPTTCTMCGLILEDKKEAFQHLKCEHGFDHSYCDQCDMKFPFINMLIRHKNIAHTVSTYCKRRYICWICRVFEHGKKTVLYDHLTNIHKIKEIDVDTHIRTRSRNTKARFYRGSMDTFKDNSSMQSEHFLSGLSGFLTNNNVPTNDSQGKIELKLPTKDVSIVYPKHFLSNMENYEGYKTPQKSDSNDINDESPSALVRKNFCQKRNDSKLNGKPKVVLPKMNTYMMNKAMGLKRKRINKSPDKDAIESKKVKINQSKGVVIIKSTNGQIEKFSANESSDQKQNIFTAIPWKSTETKEILSLNDDVDVTSTKDSKKVPNAMLKAKAPVKLNQDKSPNPVVEADAKRKSVAGKSCNPVLKANLVKKSNRKSGNTILKAKTLDKTPKNKSVSTEQKVKSLEILEKDKNVKTGLGDNSPKKIEEKSVESEIETKSLDASVNTLLKPKSPEKTDDSKPLDIVPQGILQEKSNDNTESETKSVCKTPITEFAGHLNDRRKKSNLKNDGFSCDICSSVFLVPIALQRHMFFTHGKSKTSADPKNTFLKSLNLQKNTEESVVEKKPQRKKRNESQRMKVKKDTPKGLKVKPKVKVNVSKMACKINASKKLVKNGKPLKVVSKTKKVEIVNSMTNPIKINGKVKSELKVPAKKIAIRKSLDPKILAQTVTKDNRTPKPKLDSKKRRISVDTIFDSKTDSQCSVCKEYFADASTLHRHLKVHGMAFLQLGTKKRAKV